MKIKNIGEQGILIPDEKGTLFTLRVGETVEWNGDIDTPLIRERVATKQLEVVEGPKETVDGEPRKAKST